jgi:hypothetical protein
MEKKYEHNEVETCKFCKKDIHTRTDVWASLIEYNAELQTAIGFYHSKCLLGFINGNMKVVEDKWKLQARKMMQGVMGKLKGVEVENNGI